MKVMLAQGLWIGKNTLVFTEPDAKEFETMEKAQEALKIARQADSYPHAVIEDDFF